MKTSELFGKKTIFSLEIFPPKKTSPVEAIYKTLDDLQELSPDFISVTYGAGGSLKDNATVKIAKDIKKQYNLESVAHLTCVGSTFADIKATLEKLTSDNIDNVLALRGDLPATKEPLANDFLYASDLVAFIKKHSNLNIIGACYPEGHHEAGGLENDIRNLKNKVDAGVSHLITQLFFDNNHFYRFRDRLCKAGINVPVEAGIMPVINKTQIERMVSLCKVDLPKKFTSMMARYENNHEAMIDAGTVYAAEQITDLISNGVDGIHLYTMNNAPLAKRIKGMLGSLI